MSHWMVKAAAQKAISLLPASRTWNHFFQSYVTHSLDLDRSDGPHTTRFAAKVLQCRRHVENYAARRGEPIGAVLELGTGWHPIVPIGLYLCGTNEVWTIDQERLLSLERVRDVVARFTASARDGSIEQLLPQADRLRLAEMEKALAGNPSSAEAMLERLNIHTLAGDARRTGLAAGSIDFIVSNNTLEHIPLPVLDDIFAEFRRLSSRRAVMSHFIDMADHYVNFDRRLSPYNFLRFPSSTWRWLNNPLQYLNRLRLSDYRRLHAAAGFAICSEDNDATEAGRLLTVPLAPEFRRYAPDDLAVMSSWIVSVPEGEALRGS